MTSPWHANLIDITLAVMVSPGITLPVAILATGGLIVYWQSLRQNTPPSRRRIRQANSVVQLALIANLVYVLSIVDHVQQPAAALLAWTSVALLLLLTIALAIVDATNTWRLHLHHISRLRSKARDRIQSNQKDAANDADADGSQT